MAAKAKRNDKRKTARESNVSVWLGPGMKKQLIELAEREERSVSYFVKKAVEQYFAAGATA